MVAPGNLLAISLAVLCMFVVKFSAFNVNDVQGSDTNERTAESFMEEYNNKSADASREVGQTEWDYVTDLESKDKQNASIQAGLKFAEFSKEVFNIVSQYKWKNFSDPVLSRKFQMWSVLGTAALPHDELEKLKTTVSDMEGLYGQTKVCSWTVRGKCDLNLEPDITQILQKSRDYNETFYLWRQWHDTVGKGIKTNYTKYVELSNKAAKLNNFTDMGKLWLNNYDDENIAKQFEDIMKQLKPMFEQLHAYVRKKLIVAYPGRLTKTGPLPAHVLGNMWAQDWVNIQDLITPFANKTAIDCTPELVRQNKTALDMFKIAEEFFTSLGLMPMTDEFWQKTIMTKPKDREIVCHASAWDFYNGSDFRIKMCTDITMDDLITIHHEMGHIQYFQQYAHLHMAFRDGANEGFHEAVGDTLALSVATPDHLMKIGLLHNSTSDNETDINYLMSVALTKIAFLPFAYTIDKFRWLIFEGKIKRENYNSEWWKLRLEYQGIAPAVERGNEFFDAGAKYHVAADVPYIRYFTSFIIQFQFHKALCIAAGEYDPSNPATKPLYKCDIYRNRNAGKLLADMLSLGSSKPWPEAMKVMTGDTKMDAAALIEYFAPLIEYLVKDNARTNETIGWDGVLPKFEDPRPGDFEMLAATKVHPPPTKGSVPASGKQVSYFLTLIMAGVMAALVSRFV